MVSFSFLLLTLDSLLRFVFSLYLLGPLYSHSLWKVFWMWLQKAIWNMYLYLPSKRGKLIWLATSLCYLFLLIVYGLMCFHCKHRMPLILYPSVSQGALQAPRNYCPTMGTLGKVQRLMVPMPCDSYCCGCLEGWAMDEMEFHLALNVILQLLPDTVKSI